MKLSSARETGLLAGLFTAAVEFAEDSIFIRS